MNALRSPGLVLAAMVYAAVLLPAPPAGARERTLDLNARSEALINKALALREAGNDEEALTLLKQAYELSPNPRAAAQLGTCEQALGRWTDAEEHLIEATAARGSHAWVNRNYEPLRQALEDVKAHIARIELVGSPPGAMVTVNGVTAGRLPLARPLRVNQGKVYLQLSADGYRSRADSLVVAGGQFQRVSLELERESAPVHLAARPPRAAASEGPPAALVMAPAPPPPADEAGEEGGVLTRWWFWTGVGAVVVGAVATGLLLSSGSRSSPGCPRGVDLCAR